MPGDFINLQLETEKEVNIYAFFESHLFTLSKTLFTWPLGGWIAIEESNRNTLISMNDHDENSITKVETGNPRRTFYIFCNVLQYFGYSNEKDFQ